jgi:hypothetical protein
MNNEYKEIIVHLITKTVEFMQADDSLRLSKSLASDPSQSQVSTLHNLALYFFKFHFNIIPPFMPLLSKWSHNYFSNCFVYLE